MRFTVFSSTALVLLTALCFNSTLASAQSVTATKSQLSRLEKQLVDLKTEQQQLQSSIDDYQAQITTATSRPSPEKALLDKANTRLKQAQGTYEAAPSAENKSKLTNLRFKAVLAERKFKKANTELTRLKKEAAALELQLNQTTQAITQTEADINTRRSSLGKIKSRQLAEERVLRNRQQQALLQSQQALKAEKVRASKAQAEIERLKALLAQQDSQKSSAASTPAPVSSPTTATLTSKITLPATEQQITNKAIQPPIQAQPGHREAMLLTSATQVGEEKQRLNQLLAKPDSRNLGYNKILNVKPFTAGTAKIKVEANSLKPLGHGQYRGKAKLKAGEMLFVIGFHQWRQTITASDANNTFIFNLDYSDPKNPQLLYYNIALDS